MSTRRLTEAAERVNPVAPVHIWRSPDHSSVDMLVVAHLDVYSTMHEHAIAALPNETGGFLLGRVAHDSRDGCWLVEIEEAVPVQPESQNPVHFTFTWRDVDRVRTYREGHSKALIGWYHTHPQLGIFLSETDIERTHRVLFSEPFQLALVFDPVARRAGYFFWEAAQTIDAAPAGWREFEIAVQGAADLPAAEAIAPATVATGSNDVPPSDEAPPAGPAAAGDGPSDRANGNAGETRSMTPIGMTPPPRNGVRLRLLWAVIAGIFFLLTGLAVGYFWFGPGRGLS